MKKLIKPILMAALCLCAFAYAPAQNGNGNGNGTNGNQGQNATTLSNALAVHILKEAQPFFEYHFGLNLGQLIQWYRRGDCTITPTGENLYEVRIQDCIVVIELGDIL